MSKKYVNDEDYILEILEKEEDVLLENLCEKVPEELKHDFSKFLSIVNTIEKIYKEKYNEKLNKNII
ncbi:hypothetical protein [Clostridium saccharobutylicum]|uniref:Uncharacterized protein n=1 Tax=Clostridium saccharobutylicum DSM 13864 TaxID=1345695 RepID=U5MR20_CLOSA|nr:hypothetical protein [Clostridium saccharobutylicum]AGX43254.1 hypothetical protein CLSA_c22790 [Clostridium saccharobutylicum DSM 13864]AQR90553.1 hypothetical protein CLOSC_22740 [Clostridium saccharobutylicum]AQS00457.1 hypothetical protein CSACC_22810 [Clostridium saccharobutylicum]AQS10106.1 hypothetical protein CLOBY_22490 [Clostridium saccharobutylicum]AQS14440.1 hypothetical protein CLOSACC_22810 [Clostridium saccharobutylicum]